VEIESCVAPAKDLLHKGKADQFFPKPLGKTSWVKRSQLVSALSRHGSISTKRFISRISPKNLWIEEMKLIIFFKPLVIEAL